MTLPLRLPHRPGETVYTPVRRPPFTTTPSQLPATNLMDPWVPESDPTAVFSPSESYSPFSADEMTTMRTRRCSGPTVYSKMRKSENGTPVSAPSTPIVPLQNSQTHTHDPNTQNPAFNKAFLTLSLSSIAENDPLRFCSLPPEELILPRFRELQQHFIAEHMKWTACLILAHFKDQYRSRLPREAENWHIRAGITASPPISNNQPVSLEDSVIRNIHLRRQRRPSLSPTSIVSPQVTQFTTHPSLTEEDRSAFNPLVDPTSLDFYSNSTVSLTDPDQDDVLDFGLGFQF
ncbi:hypothetical protein RCL1_001404 [Eukaryota sp. TZLM3-RCL]